MSGVLIAGGIFRSSAALTAVVPAANIKAWALPQNSPARSILVTKISRVEVQFLAEQGVNLVTERVQATIRAESGVAREDMILKARAAARMETGTVAGFENVAVLLAGDGPDFMDDSQTIFMGSIDLRVSFNEPV